MLRSTALIAGLLVTLTSCGVDSTLQPNPTPVPTTVTVSPGTSMLDAVGATVQLSAVVQDQNGSPISGQALTWTSSAPTVASVSTAGLVTAVGKGTTSIMAAAGNVNGSAAVVVQQVPAVLNKVAGDAQSGMVGESLTSSVTVRVADSRGNPVEGESVSFSVTSGGGSVSPATVTSGSDGTAVTTWTLGTDASEGQALQAAAGGVTADFTATALPGPAQALTVVSGSGQTGFGGVPLSEPLVVAVQDSYGNGVEGETVTFTAPAGNGTVSPTEVASDAAGRAQTIWTLSEDAGVQTVTASIASGASVDLTATSAGVASPPVITTISPAELVEGGQATISGEHFLPDPAANAVQIDGVTAAVQSATPTSLTVLVPSFACEPAREVSVTVTTAGLAGDPVSHPLRPAAFTDLTDGEPTIITGGGQVCIQLPADPSGGDYLIGIQNFDEDANVLTPVRLDAVVDPAAGVVAPVARPKAPAAGLLAREPAASPLLRRLAGHRAAEARFMARERELLERMDPAEAASPGGPASVPNLDVGATTALRVRDHSAGATCNQFADITATVWAKTANAIWFHDNANPAGGYTQSDIQALAAALDPQVFQAHENEFGPQPDVDNNDRIAIVITEQINIQNGSTGILQAFVSGCDFSARAAAPASNEGETFYMLAPDPNGEHGQELSVADGLAQAPFLLAHEITHLVQLARSALNGRPLMDIYYLEGQATVAEEVVGHAVLGNQRGQNYLFNTAWNFLGDELVSWYASAFADLVWWFGGQTGPDQTQKTPGAPEECTWLDDVGDPCISRPSYYGVAWSLLRWLADQYYPTNEPSFHQALINSNQTGLALLESVTGVSREVFLPYWSAALYLDDRESVDPMLTFTSWNLFDIFEGNDGTYQILASGRPRPRDRTFSAFQDEARVRAGSTAYWRISGATQPGTSVRVWSQSLGDLPPEMTVYVIPIP